MATGSSVGASATGSGSGSGAGASSSSTGVVSMATGSTFFFSLGAAAVSSAAMSAFFLSRGFLAAGGTFSASSGLTGTAGLGPPPPKKDAMLR